MRKASFLLPSLWVCSLTLILAGSAQGQSRSGAGARGQQDLQSREWALTHVGDDVNSHFSRASTTPQPNVREDFHQLQIANNELMKAVFVRNCVEPGQILAAVAEIKKRAAHLKVNLGFDAAGSDVTRKRGTDDKSRTPAPGDRPALSPALLRLDRAVMSFVNNPLFQQPKLVDSKLMTKAGEDLTEILRLVDVIKGLESSVPQTGP